jgi:hypothetical protein
LLFLSFFVCLSFFLNHIFPKIGIQWIFTFLLLEYELPLIEKLSQLGGNQCFQANLPTWLRFLFFRYFEKNPFAFPGIIILFASSIQFIIQGQFLQEIQLLSIGLHTWTRLTTSCRSKMINRVIEVNCLVIVLLPYFLHNIWALVSCFTLLMIAAWVAFRLLRPHSCQLGWNRAENSRLFRWIHSNYLKEIICLYAPAIIGGLGSKLFFGKSSLPTILLFAVFGLVLHHEGLFDVHLEKKETSLNRLRFFLANRKISFWKRFFISKYFVLSCFCAVFFFFSLGIDYFWNQETFLISVIKGLGVGILCFGISSFYCLLEERELIYNWHIHSFVRSLIPCMFSILFLYLLKFL